MNEENNLNRDRKDRSIAKFAAKDSLFTDLFKDKKYLLQLYKALHPEDKDVEEKDLKPITLESVIMANTYNDLGVLVKGGKILILLEHQSSWTMNIIIRMFMYLADTYNNYYIETKQTLYGNKKVDFPKPELYVIYPGEKGSRKEIISLAEEFLDDEESSLEVKVKVIFDGEEGDIINQYVTFTKIYNEQIKLYGRTREAVMQTIRICENKNILREYLQNREKEVVNIMMALFDAEYNLNVYIDNIAKEAKEEGWQQGKQQGWQQGRQQGEIISMVKMCKEFGVSFSDTVKRISSEFGLTEPDAEIKVKENWK